MIEYIICFLFWLLFTMLIYGVGRAFTNKEESSSYYFVAGYLVYSAVVAIGGVAVQLLNLPWIVFAGYMFLTWGAILVFLIVRRKRFVNIHLGKVLLSYIRENWMIFFVCLFLCGMLFFYYQAFWYGNHLDDGYYVTKVATMPYNTTGFRTNYSVGVLQAGVDSYVFNTWELESSFYVKLLHVAPTLFLRLFQSAFNYFLILNCFKLFAERIFKKLARPVQSAELQLVTIITVLFGGFYLFLTDVNLFTVRDMFQFNSAIYYGASLDKILSILLLLVFFIEIRKINLKMILVTLCIAGVLLSKSSIVLPIIGITVFAYWEMSLWINYGKKGKVSAIVFLLIYIIIGIILPGNEGGQQDVYKYAVTVVTSPIMILCTLMFVFSFFLREKVIVKLNCILLICMCAMLVPQVNDVFETLSVFRFVAGRAWTTWVYTYILLNFIYLYLICCRYLKNKKIIKAAFITSGVLLMAVDALAFNIYGGELFETEKPVEADVKFNLRTILNNKYFVPNSTMELGGILEQLSEKRREKLRVVMPEGVPLDRTVQNLAVQIRIFAPDIVVPSAINRYPVDEDSGLNGYSQSFYEEFEMGPSNITSGALEKELNKYNIDSVVTVNDECGDYLKKMGYQLYQSTTDGIYKIWYR